MKSSVTFSSRVQLEQLADILSKYARLPFSQTNIPGAVMEGALAYVRRGKVLRTYDFVDVINLKDRCGWQVKSTMETTPVTWKRAKLPNAETLIKDSHRSTRGARVLGKAIIDFCNAHAAESLEKYDLDQIGYSRLIVMKNSTVTYFEKLLCSKERPLVFDPLQFEWHWSKPKTTVKKEQLPALHGIHRQSGRKWFAWHGLGENQLHFAGEKSWWPELSDAHVVTFKWPLPDERVDLDKFIKLLAALDV